MKPAPIPVVVVVGPTASGKTDLAVRLAEVFDGEVISADALQIYRGLDIGTGKVDAESAARVRHHCLDIADPNEAFSAGRYGRAARIVVEDVHARGKLPIVAGGSGLYIRALVEGLAEMPPKDPRWRRALEIVGARRGAPFIARMMRELDPDWAAATGDTDLQRLMRGLEVTLREGKPMSKLLGERGWSGTDLRPHWVALTMPRQVLYQRIESRIDAMLADGWLDEVRGLRDRGYGRDAPGLQAIGYRELTAHLQGELSLAEAREAICVGTRRYAKRQLTWFRGQTPAQWFQIDDETPASRQRIFESVEAELRAQLT